MLSGWRNREKDRFKFLEKKRKKRWKIFNRNYRKVWKIRRRAEKITGLNNSLYTIDQFDLYILDYQTISKAFFMLKIADSVLIKKINIDFHDK